MSDIDIVIPWVDGADPVWLETKQQYESPSTADRWYNGPIRYRDWENLQYVFRGIEKFAPWVRKVHFITCGHLPHWMDISCQKLHIVRHEEYIPAEFLPTFNANTIELNMHRIDGLTEQFIYFNDDTFLTNVTEPEDFFKKGLPCDSAILNPIPMTRHRGNLAVNNIGIINDHFIKNKVLAQNPWKWFTLRYGKFLIRNFLIYPWKDFVGLYEQHLPSAFLKSTFETVWQKEEAELRKTCTCRFREATNVTQWLMKNWQLAAGQFMPRSMNVGRLYEMGDDDNYAKIYRQIRGKRWKMICVNDSNDIDDYPRRKRELQEAFEAILPEKSDFELP